MTHVSPASVKGRVALGPRSGTAVERIGRRARAERPLSVAGERCCDIERFSLPIKVLIAGADRRVLERLCRCIACPPIQVERLSLDPAGRVIYPLRRDRLWNGPLGRSDPAARDRGLSSATTWC